MSKSDKYMGVDAPIVRRRTDPVPPRATPKASSERAIKRYGYSWIWVFFNKKRKRSFTWFKTEAARDQSYEAIIHKRDALEYAVGPNSYSMRDLRKESKL